MPTQTTRQDLPAHQDHAPVMNGHNNGSVTDDVSIFEYLREFWGIYKDDPDMREVLDGIIAERHADRQDDVDND